MGIGKKLDMLMKERGTNANELAGTVGIAPTTIYSMINRDSRKADIDTLLKISRALGVTAEYFCDEAGDEPATLAAHLDTGDLTQEELDDISNYIHFVKSKRNL